MLTNKQTGLLQKGIPHMTTNTIISLSIILVFLIGIIIVGKIAGNRVKSSDDYLVANRGASLALIVGTLFATFWGGGTIIGGAGAAYNDGIFGVVEDPFAAGLALILIGFFFVKLLRRLNIKSVGELYTLRFGEATGYLASALMIPTYVIWTAVQLLAIGKIVNILFDVDFMLAFLLAAVVVVAFTYMGGIIAVVWTDAIQMVIIFIGLVAILIVGFQAAGGIGEVVNHTPEDYWNILPRENSVRSWITYIAMWAGMGLGNIPSPDVAQRAFMAKDASTAKKGMIIAGGLYWTVGFIPIIIGLIGITLVSQGTLDGALFAVDSELLIPYLAKELLGPVGLGIFVASLIAAILSSASTSLFATAVLFSNDIYKPLMKHFRKRDIEEDSKGLLYATRIFVLIVGVLSVMVGFLSDNIYDLTIFAFTLQFGMLFFPFVFALKAKWANTYGIIAGMLSGLLVNVIGCVAQGTILPEPWEFYTLVPALVSFIMIVLVSKLTKNKSKPVPLEELLQARESKN
jgi:SSS family transporter